MMRRIWPVVLLGMVLVLTTGCGVMTAATVLAPAPNLYTFETGDTYPAEAVPEGLRGTEAEILYVTDRNPITDKEGQLVGYGTKRSDSMAFGASHVDYGELQSWEDLVARTQDTDTSALTRLTPVALSEIVRFPATPLAFERVGPRLKTLPKVEAAYRKKAAVLKKDVSSKLRQYELSRVLVYVHGVNNEFDDSVATLANLWHYSGRQSLPIAYSWPAGNEGILKYFRDVGAGEFSVFHVKEFLRLLASVPELDRIDIVAHSRGSAVMADALRELMIEARGAGKAPRDVLKTGILVMAAPDLDIGVARQRLIAERFGEAFEQINIYANPDDGALRLSRIIGKATRLGSLTEDNFRMDEIASLTRAGNVNFIIVEQEGGRLGHSYFRQNPAVISDIVLALRSRQLPGTDFRPLEHGDGNIWFLRPNYPAARLPEVLDLKSPDR